MEILDSLKSFEEIVEEWNEGGASAELARLLTLRQVYVFEKIINDDESYTELLTRFNNGRLIDSWLATDWPKGFDELVLCGPLCKYVDWQCGECMVGKRQQNHSCEDENSVFGWTAELLKLNDREALQNHITNIKVILEDDNKSWDLSKHSVIG